MLLKLPSQQYCGDLWLAHVELAPLGGWKVDAAQRLLCWGLVDHEKPAKTIHKPVAITNPSSEHYTAKPQTDNLMHHKS